MNKILESYKKMFPNENFLNVKSPLEKNDHPELDYTELCNEELITKYMCMIGQLQWAIMLGRYDILAHFMSMSSFRLAPKIGCLERMKRLYGYLAKTKHFAIRYRTKGSDCSHLPKHEYEWMSMEMSKKKLQGHTQTIRKDGNNHHIPRCQPTPSHCSRKISHTCVALCQHHPNRLVFEVTSHCCDSNIWFRVCSCQNSNRTNHGPQKHTKISRCPHDNQGIHVW